MGLGVSLIFIAVGAMLAFAVHVHNSSAFDVNTIGIILLVVGIVGALLSMIFWSSWAGPGYFARAAPHLRRRRPVAKTARDRPAAGACPLRTGARPAGSSNEKVEPRPSARGETTQSRPFMRWTSSRQMYRPRPVPPTPRVRFGSSR